MSQSQLPDYLFPVALEDFIPLEITEALPLPDAEYIGIGDQVAYERLNDRGEVVMRAFGTVSAINYTKQLIRLHVTPFLRFWVSVNSVSLALNGAANTAAIVAVSAA